MVTDTDTHAGLTLRPARQPERSEGAYRPEDVVRQHRRDLPDLHTWVQELEARPPAIR